MRSQIGIVVREPSMSEVRERIKAWMRYFMREEELDQRGLAQALRLKEPTVSNILRDKRPAGLKTLIKLHLAFGESMSRMVLRDPEAAPRRPREQPET